MRKDWVETNIDSLLTNDCKFVDGDWVESKDQDPQGEVRLIQLADIGDGKFKDKSDRYMTHFKSEELNCTYLKKNDILIARMPDPLGRACIFPYEQDESFVTVVDVAIVRLDDKFIDKKFILNMINAPHFRIEIDKLKSGSTRKRISRKNLATLKLPLAPLLEQKAIVAKIEQLFSELDNGIENLKTAQAKLKIYRQAVLKKAFEGELTKEWREKQTNLQIADELLKELDNEKYQLGYEIKNRVDKWSYYPIGNICNFQQGMQIAKSSRLKEYEEGTLPILRIKNYRDGFKTDVEYIKVDENSLIAEPEDLIVTRTGESRGDILTGYRGVFHNNTFRINYNESIFTRKYLLYYLTFSEVQNYIKFVSGRTGQPDLTHRNFGPCPIIIPSISEQIQIVQEIESRLSVCDKIEEIIGTSLSKSEALRQSILKRAFEGKLLSEQELENIKKHPEYESAQALLERIKKEREK